jgi:hypothetical protein
MIEKLPEGFNPNLNTLDTIDKSSIVDVHGNPIKYGKDPNDPTLGPDDNPKFEMRKADDYPNVPPQVKQAEIQYILPMANFLAQSLGINLIDEKLYTKILDPLRQRSLMVLLNLERMQLQDGVAAWYGLIMMCKKHPLVMTKFKLHLGTGRIGIASLRLWSKADQKYIVYGDREQKTFLDRQKTAVQILDYLKMEGVCNV